MKLSTGFWQTYKETPADAEIASHQLMMRAGLIHKSGSGLYSYLPFGYRSIRKVEQIIREELDRVGCHEISMPMVTPGELWKESGRWDRMGADMIQFKDKADRDLCLSPTAEEAATDIFRNVIKSYKQLPVTIYQIKTKFRDEIRPRFGLMRGREFTMKDGYSFHADKESLDQVYNEIFTAYKRIFDRIGFLYAPVEADGGDMASSESKTHEFQVIADTGEDKIIYCEETGYAANIEKAKTLRSDVNPLIKTEKIIKIETPRMESIDDVCRFLNIKKEHALKSIAFQVSDKNQHRFVMALILGDDEINEIKLNALYPGCSITLMTDNELLSHELIKGYMGPYQLPQEAEILIDEAVEVTAAFVTGGNLENYHFSNVIPERDIKEYKKADLRLAKDGDKTIDGEGIVKTKRGIEVAHIFQLGDKYTKAMNVTILDKNGKTMAPLMGCYGIGVTRVVAAVVEQNHDDQGIIWPVSIAPYHVYFAEITKSSEYKDLAAEIYKDLIEAGIEVVFDDRKAGPGFKFKDADLLGLPFQLVLGERDHKKDGLFEIRIRKTGEKLKVERDDIVSKLQSLIEAK